MIQTCLAVVLAVLTCFPGPDDEQSGPSTPETAAEGAVLTLGKFLFESELLSANRRVSCATCHDSGLSFTDGQAESLGILEVGVGRNAPALVGVKHVEHFPGPRLTDDDPLARPAALTLAERCLAPIENPLEMGSSLIEVEMRLTAIPQVRKMFIDAFGKASRSVTPERIGDALAAHIRSVELPETTFARHLAGDRKALDPIERRGFEIFNQGGKCASCHTGDGLTDGLVHIAFTPQSRRARQQRDRLAKLRNQIGSQQEWLQIDYPMTGIARELLQRFQPQRPNMCEPAQQNGYGGFPQGGLTESHNLSLLDVARTGPYFRDGSVKELDRAVAQHVHELREVWADRTRIGKRLKVERRNRDGLPRKLRPRWAAKGAFRPPRPDELDSGDRFALVKYLETLSPGS